MQFINIRFRNLFSFGSQYTELDLGGNGITFVKGTNKDDNTSNGSGKSSIPNIFVWALYGKPLKNVPADFVVNKHTEGGAHACIEFVIGENHYEVNRYREDNENGNALIIKCNGMEVENGTLRDAQRKLDEILGVDYNSFVNSTIFSTEVPFQLPHLTPANRREYLENILGLKAYSEYGKTAKSMVRSLRKQADGIEIELREKRKFLINEKDEYEAYTKKVSEYKGLKEAEIANLESELERLKKEQSTIDLDRVSSIKKEIEEVTIRLEDVRYEQSETETKKLELQSLIRELESKISYAQKTASSNVSNEERITQKEVSQIQKRIELIQHECPTCNRDWEPEEVKTLTKMYEEKIESLNNDLSTKIGSIEDELTKSLKGYKATIKSHDSEIEELEVSIAEFQGRCVGIVETLSELKEELSGLPTQETYNNLSDKIESAAIRIEKKRVEENPYISVVEKCKEKIISLMAAIDDIDSNRKVLEERLKYISFWDDSFNNDGLKLFIFESIIPLLNSRIAYYLPILFGEKQAKVDFDTMMNMYVNIGGEEVTYGNLSQGEKKRIDLALSLSLLDTAQAQFGTISNVMFFDELLDGSLDTDGVKSAVQILQSMPVDSIFLVSHRTEISNEFDNVLEVEKSNNISRIVR